MPVVVYGFSFFLMISITILEQQFLLFYSMCILSVLRCLINKQMIHDNRGRPNVEITALAEAEY